MINDAASNGDETVSIDWMLVISELEMMQKDSVVAQLR
jgi:hypothetical protein